MNNNNTNDEIITLTTPEGEDVNFIELAGIVLEDNFYVILQNIDDEDDIQIFNVIESGEQEFYPVDDDIIYQKVLFEYLKLVEEN